MPKEALLIVDVQNDFCPGGTLAVPDGDMVVQPLNNMIQLAKDVQMLVVASRDWHPPVTSHFNAYGGKWPVHCVHNTWGAKFHPNLLLPSNVIVISKGTEKNEDAYSAFQGFLDNNGRFLRFSVDEFLRKNGFQKLYIGGLATDYCVKETVLDALRLGFEVTVIEDAIRGVEINPGDCERAISEMKQAGAKFTTTDIILGFYTPPYE
ncbi:MAG: hypothetical protein A3G49_00250 [Candidatus Sungbacteria bacterium RIFCSPLOWO2_12_FULL_41_11]|uniref:nicotinamidase n=1 Tax=Candidatus Sungbacteria bacterium RIFCSPLOWO2_12_FULL_41_11 TaxID=1802286 RepID=A0A1G2LPF1_9BACT|nr:MAG: Pyrazinamidase/nicotinamidase [Parcubacteria group bacterium GW2011_GWA2_42_14]OGZ98212.1 MAG: hypothetical protein A3D41_02900 [Candidatus Sungbacteria bacterium RIFCSPHIGHO2_02_FULL_41_12b]OHA12691.1 MAG: hypothetical protein A3G49_00250 [Candidatus Sungbacteria bacterium RIFCSPLOWO2_12_FULL_41_11]